MHVYTYILCLIHILIGTYLVCCFVQRGLRCVVLCFAVLAVQRHACSYLHATAVLLFVAVYVPVQRKKKVFKTNNGK